MGFGEAFINLQLIFQKLIDTPIMYDPQNEKFISNPKLKTIWKMPIYHPSISSVFCYYLYCIYRILRIYRSYKETGNINPPEILFHGLALCLETFTMITVYSFEKNPEGFGFVKTQILRIRGIKHNGWPNSKRLPDLQELVTYGFAVGYFNFPIAALIAPFLLDQDPINAELKDVLPPIPRRIFASFLCATTVFYSALVNGTFLLGLMTCCYALEKLTEMNLKLSLGESGERNSSRLEQNIQTILEAILHLV
ncbi:unnamed protein product [Orchesella dallaii]|uniref:Uncharacterized protein n=1 Tax=Orchesella dallaii TaxID=48710 RepID=A0ABP1QFG6_9HEXA